MDKLERLVDWVMRAGAEGGWRLATIVAVLLAVIVVAAMYLRAPEVAGVPLPATSINVLPTTGEQGYDVQAFCADPLTTVARDFYAPPDSAFAATYTLDRTRDGVHETVYVGMYADESQQPRATHYAEGDTVGADGFVSKDAAACIRERAK